MLYWVEVNDIPEVNNWGCMIKNFLYRRTRQMFSTLLVFKCQFIRLKIRENRKTLSEFKRLLILLFVALILNLSHPPLPQAAPKVQFSIVYTNDVMGEVEPCG